jgi:hypothetical protein
VTPYGLRVEHLDQPLGLYTVDPRLSCLLTPVGGYGATQTRSRPVCLAWYSARSA